MLLLILGCFGGFLFGMVGIGGNVLYIPIFGYLLGQLGFQGAELTRAVVANALLILVFTGSAVAWKQYRVGNFFFKEVILTASTGVLMAFTISTLIKSGDWYDKRIFDVVFATILALMLLRFFLPQKNAKAEDFQLKTNNYQLLGVGLVTGVLTAFSGLGGSIIMIPLFTEILGLPIKKAHSIAVCVVPILALTISVFYFFGKPHISPMPTNQLGYLNFGISIPVIVGSVITAPLGVKAAHSVKPRTQKLVFVVIVGVVLCKMIYNYL